MMDIGQNGSGFPNVRGARSSIPNILTLLKVHFYDT